jgi:nucleotide-binding universal stress UspA family protein
MASSDIGSCLYEEQDWTHQILASWKRESMYQKVLIAVDGSDEAINAAEETVKLGLTKGAEVLIMGALDISGITFQGLNSLNEEEMNRIKEACRQRNLAGVEKALRALGVSNITPLIVENTPAAAISDTAEKENADVVVVGRRGIGAIRSFFMGSVSLKVLELCECPVLVVPKDYIARGPLKTLVIPTDFSAAANYGLLHAAKLAKFTGARIVLVHDCQVESDTDNRAAEASAQLEAIAAPLREDGVVVKCVVYTAGVARSIIGSVEEESADLIVMSSHGRSGMQKFFLGSFATNVVKASEVPVLVVMKA